MRRLLLLLIAAGFALTNTGCFINEYSADPTRRIKQLLNQSEDLRLIEDEWERFWMIDHPSHLSYDRIDGSIE
jgi:hypothetical protein